MPENRDWKKSQSIKDGPKGMKGDERLKSGVSTGTDQGLSSSRGIPTKKCPIHEMGKHTLQECRKFVDMPVDEKERIVLKNRLCVSCLSLGHRLNQCVKRVRCQVENCGRRHHTSVHEMDKRFTERTKAKKQEPEKSCENQEAKGQPPSADSAEHGSCSSFSMTGFCSEGQSLVEVLPVVIYGNNERKKMVMVLRDSGCNTTLMEEDLATLLCLEGREVDIELKA